MDRCEHEGCTERATSRCSGGGDAGSFCDEHAYQWARADERGIPGTLALRVAAREYAEAKAR